MASYVKLKNGWAARFYVDGVKLKDLKPTDIQSYYSSKVASGLSNHTVRHNHRVLSLALKWAVKWGLINSNPCDSVKPPKPESVIMITLNDDEIKGLLTAARKYDAFIAIYIGAVTGMRLGEIVGLQLEDVDFKRQVFRVRHNYQRIGGVDVLTTPKTAKSTRVVPWLPGTDKVLDEYMRLREFKSKYHAVDSYHFCVFADGRPMSGMYVTKCFKKLVRRLGLSDYIHFHTLRHTHATYLLRQGLHPKIVSERLGHTSITITMDTYSHVLPDIQTDALKNILTNVYDIW